MRWVLQANHVRLESVEDISFKIIGKNKKKFFRIFFNNDGHAYLISFILNAIYERFF